MKRDALVSPCGRFRYYLTRKWGPGPALVFVMLNPSTANADVDDNTIRKCVRFAELSGYGSIIVVNLFAYRATNPADLKAAFYPVGPLNATYVAHALKDRDVILAWGANARGLPQAALVEMTADILACRVGVLRRLRDGTPEHPLYIPYSCWPVWDTTA